VFRVTARVVERFDNHIFVIVAHSAPHFDGIVSRILLVQQPVYVYLYPHHIPQTRLMRCSLPGGLWLWLHEQRALCTNQVGVEPNQSLSLYVAESIIEHCDCNSFIAVSFPFKLVELSQLAFMD
jgi:hypothetical protein